jgi:hypothetical protein
MAPKRLALRLSLLVFTCGLAGIAAFADGPGPIRPQAEEMRLTLTGTVRMADGSPASGATVESTDDPDVESRQGSPGVARTDATGRFQLRGMFGNGAHLYARSADGTHQTTLRISSLAARSASATPVELTLAPAVNHEVVVLADGRPVEGAHVVASGMEFHVHGVTGADGQLKLRLPARGRLQEVVAWHRRMGVSGARELEARPASDKTELTLSPPGPLWIRVVDPDDHPVPDLELAISVRTSRDWAVVDKLEAARVRTGADGTAIVTWAPREKLGAVDPSIISPDWKVDGTDLAQTGDRVRNRVVTIHARRKAPVEGRLIMPAGASPEGLLITGFGFGPRNRGDIPYARARADGSFTLRVASEHGYVLGVVDLQWATDVWSGLILAGAAGKPADIRMSAYRATPVTVRVTRGERHTPVDDAWVELGGRGEVKWVDANGHDRRGRAALRSWLTTDGKGVVQAGAARGEYNVRLVAGDWNEERPIAVSSDKPVEVEFHRAWQGKRQVTGRLIDDDKPFRPSARLVARAWSPRPRTLPPSFQPAVKPDGIFRVAFDEETLALFFSDPEKRRSGFARLGVEESSVELKMVAMATYSGTLRDEKGQPMPGETVKLSVKTSDGEPIVTRQTDKAGRFRFDDVPAGVPLSMYIGNGVTPSGYFLADGDRLFQPGEIRANDEVKPRLRDSRPPVAHAPVPATSMAARIEDACRSIRGSGMYALVVLQGDESGNVVALADRLLNDVDDDRVDLIVRYLPVRVGPAELKTGAAFLGKSGWPLPAPGQVVLVALNGDRETIATTTIAADPTAVATRIGEGFLKQHLPPTRDARALMAAARDEARKSGRRVWIIESGPRCAPCFRLGRWIDDHHAVLEKDFVIVKVMGGLDAQAAEVVKELPISDGDGIPWHAITEPDGTILVTSHGALGNIGFPSTLEGIRHFRQMLERTVQKLTAADVDDLIRSLSPKP